MTGRPPVAWRGVTVYLVLAFGLAWAAQIAFVSAQRALADLPAILTATATLVSAAALMWPPAVGAFVARRWVERSGFADAGLRWPRGRYILLAWLGPPVLALSAIAVSLPLYPIDWNLETLREALSQSGQEFPLPPAAALLMQTLLALTLAVPINSVFAFGEEFGWRGYLLPRLLTVLGPWPGLLVHGAIWGFWHAPLIYLIGYNYPGHNLLGVPLFIVFCTLAGVLLGWLQLASDSVLAPTIAHASLNAIGGLPLLLLHGVDPAVGGVIYSPLGWIPLAVAIVLALRIGGLASLLHRPASAASTPGIAPG
uniref:CPBP family intramembrane metalloprotease n=1 Tax=Thermorudis peleae TaxID=1382356 RepID=A0A831TK16_9BACT